jgi:hypothetical protein
MAVIMFLMKYSVSARLLRDIFLPYAYPAVSEEVSRRNSTVTLSNSIVEACTRNSSGMDKLIFMSLPLSSRGTLVGLGCVPITLGRLIREERLRHRFLSESKCSSRSCTSR